MHNTFIFRKVGLLLRDSLAFPGFRVPVLWLLREVFPDVRPVLGQLRVVLHVEPAINRLDAAIAVKSGVEAWIRNGTAAQCRSKPGMHERQKKEKRGSQDDITRLIRVRNSRIEANKSTET